MSGDQITAAIMFVVAASLCLLIWGLAIAEYRELKAGPPPPHDPASYFDDLVANWVKGPMALHDWFAGGPMPDDREPSGRVVVAELVTLPEGNGTDDTGTTQTTLTLRLPDGAPTRMRVDSNDPTNLRLGTFLPVRPSPPDTTDLRGATWMPAFDLTGGEVAHVLLEHRRALGLLGADAADLLRNPRLGRFPVSALRPTGVIRAGQVEVVVTFLRDGSALSVQGFLRPDEVAACRHTGRVVVTRVADGHAGHEGRWTLWPRWF